MNPALTQNKCRIAELMGAIWAVQDELASAFNYPLREQYALVAELRALYVELCDRTGHEPDETGEQCSRCEEYLT